jgi:hypothetical protein
MYDWAYVEFGPDDTGEEITFTLPKFGFLSIF